MEFKLNKDVIGKLLDGKASPEYAKQRGDKLKAIRRIEWITLRENG